MVRRVTAAVRLLAGDKEPVRLASTGNLALAKLLTVDGVVTEPGDRVLVKDQTNAAENGIYTASERAWSRATDSSSSQVMIAGMKVYVQEGSTHAGSTWVLATDRPNFRTDSIQYDLYLSTNVISTVEAAASAANLDAAAAAASAATATAAAISILGATSPPPPSSFKALAIKTASTTTISVVAEFVVVTDGTNFKTVAINAILNIGLAGLVNRLDTGSLAAATWYSIWAIAKPDGTSGALASTSATSPTLPTGYTYKARIGWTRTIDGAATLYGIYQFGRRAQYVVGSVSGTPGALPALVNQSSAIGSIHTPTYVAASVSGAVPSTASVIHLAVGIKSDNSITAIVLIAPNGNYGPYNSSTVMAPITSVVDLTGARIINQGFTASLVLESSSIFVASSVTANLYIGVLGWEDNL
jgi:phage-related tail fiber protein